MCSTAPALVPAEVMGLFSCSTCSTGRMDVETLSPRRRTVHARVKARPESVEAEFVLAESEQVRNARFSFDFFLGARVAVNDHCHGHHLSARLAHTFDGGQ